MAVRRKTPFFHLVVSGLLCSNKFENLTQLHSLNQLKRGICRLKHLIWSNFPSFCISVDLLTKKLNFRGFCMHFFLVNLWYNTRTKHILLNDFNHLLLLIKLSFGVLFSFFVPSKAKFLILNLVKVRLDFTILLKNRTVLLSRYWHFFTKTTLNMVGNV